jgi:hypothetical protein
MGAREHLALQRIFVLAAEALEIDGSNHKQYYLERIGKRAAEALGKDPPANRGETAIAP